MYLWIEENKFKIRYSQENLFKAVRFSKNPTREGKVKTEFVQREVRDKRNLTEAAGSRNSGS